MYLLLPFQAVPKGSNEGRSGFRVKIVDTSRRRAAEAPATIARGESLLSAVAALSTPFGRPPRRSVPVHQDHARLSFPCHAVGLAPRALHTPQNAKATRQACARRRTAAPETCSLPPGSTLGPRSPSGCEIRARSAPPPFLALCTAAHLQLHPSSFAGDRCLRVGRVLGLGYLTRSASRRKLRQRRLRREPTPPGQAAPSGRGQRGCRAESCQQLCSSRRARGAARGAWEQTATSRPRTGARRLLDRGRAALWVWPALPASAR